MYIDAVMCGMSKHDFYHSTVNDVNIYMYAYEENQREKAKLDDYNAWLYGSYVRSAIVSAFDSNNQYAENPLAKSDSKSIAERAGKTEEQMNQELVMATMMIRQANAEITKNIGTDKLEDGGNE